MTHAEYAMYAALFDAVAAIIASAPERMTSLDLRGAVAATALREWGAHRKIDVTPDTCEHVEAGKRDSWTMLRCRLPGGLSELLGIGGDITVHLDDHIVLAVEAA